MTPDQAALGLVFLKCFAACLLVTLTYSKLPAIGINDTTGACEVVVLLSMAVMELSWVVFLSSIIPRPIVLAVLGVTLAGVSMIVISKVVESTFRSIPQMPA